MIEIVKDVPYLFRLFSSLVFKQEFGFSFNVADRCPIGCNCYWRAQPRVREMEDDDVVTFFNEMRQQGYLISVLVGGEPYVRPHLLRRLTPILPATWIVTSGTTPLIRLPKTTHFISVDGRDEKTHDIVRQSKGLFRRIIKNLEYARSSNDFPAYIHTVLNAMNYREIYDILSFWRDNNLADGVIFSTLTPINSDKPIDNNIRLSDLELEQIVDDLLDCKKEFGNFIVNTEEMIKLYRPSVMSDQTPESCGTARFVLSFDAAGQRMRQCILSDLADCSRCGCVISAIFKTLMQFPPSFTSIKELSRLRTRN